MADPSPLLCQSNSCTDDQESSDQRSHKQSISSLDEIVEQGIGGFGVYTEAEPTWHCLNNTTCSSASNICMFPKSSWAWDGNPTTTALTIISEWGLECSSAFIKGLPAASHFTGCLLGIVFLATLADSSLGRKNLLFLSCLTMSVATSLTIFSNNLWIYSLLRFFSGISRATIGTCTIVLLTEKVGTEWRGLVVILDSFFFTIGTLTLPAIAYTNRSSSWTIIYLWTSIPTLVYSGLLYIFVSESPRWLFMQGRQEEAVEVIKSLSPIKDSNQLSLSLVSAVSFGHEPAASSKESSFLSSIRELFVRRWALERTLALMVPGFGIGVVYYGMTLGIENLGFDIYLGVVFNALLEIPVWGIYFDKTSHDEQVSGSRIPRTGIFCRSQRLRWGDPVNDGWRDVHSWPRIKARSPSSHDYDNGASTSESLGGDGRGLWEGSDSREAYKRVTNEGKAYVSDLSVGGITPGKHPVCSDLSLCTWEFAEKKSYEKRSCIMAVVANDISNAGKRMRIGLELASLFSAYIAYTVIFIYAIELFPTCVRNSATSIMRLAIIFAAIFSSVLVAAGSNNEFVSYGVFGLVIICCGFFVICLPETRGSSLCDTIDQREHKDSVTV
ncbi:Organic cation/carnitine transporter 2 [Citrus sinensis]|uniref:Organic cation/carnitine transporter 2 n=1 Tax=Citrus sinensis TaxID=2711 RepID=A0ACB8HQM9_CITSI|nr:Organic cation/carnitine transporter 2 [Citrus sinensis]